MDPLNHALTHPRYPRHARDLADSIGTKLNTYLYVTCLSLNFVNRKKKSDYFVTNFEQFDKVYVPTISVNVYVHVYAP